MQTPAWIPSTQEEAEHSCTNLPIATVLLGKWTQEACCSLLVVRLATGSLGNPLLKVYRMDKAGDLISLSGLYINTHTCLHACVQTHTQSHIHVQSHKERRPIIKGTTHQEDTTTKSIFTSNLRAPNFIKQILMDRKGQRHPHTIAVGGFNILFSFLDRSFKQRLAKKPHS